MPKSKLTAWEQFFWSLGIVSSISLAADLLLLLAGKKKKSVQELETELHYCKQFKGYN